MTAELAEAEDSIASLTGIDDEVAQRLQAKMAASVQESPAPVKTADARAGDVQAGADKVSNRPASLGFVV